jgi:hypothetical protein
MQAVSYHNYVSVSWVDLVQSVHQERVSRVIQNKQENDCWLALALSAVYKSDRSMLHFTCAQSLSMDIVQFFDFERSLSCDGHSFSFAQQEDWFLMLKQLCKLSALLFINVNDLWYIGRNLLKLFSNFLNQFQGSTVFLLCNFSGESDEIEHLMKEALGGSYTSFSSNFDIDWEVYFSSQSWTLHIDDTYRINLLFVLQIIHNTDQILSLTWLADYHYSFVLGDVMRI